ncbi:MAG: OmpA family protein, partial [Rubrivivax sp.]|nr:OmpA family protein [Rubrivivax sp.]
LTLLVTLASAAVAGGARAGGPGAGRLPDTPSMIEALQPAAAPEPRPGLSLPIQFEPNSTQVRPESGVLLGNLVAAMLSPELRTNRFVIEGHADTRGGSMSNQRLSQLRAEEVRLYLVALGVNPTRLKAVGKGAAEPAMVRDPFAAENRRVRVVTVE